MKLQFTVDEPIFGIGELVYPSKTTGKPPLIYVRNDVTSDQDMSVAYHVTQLETQFDPMRHYTYTLFLTPASLAIQQDDATLFPGSQGWGRQ